MSKLARGPWRRIILLGFVLAWSGPLLADASGSMSPAQPYHLGQGLYFPQQALRVGGYADLQFHGLDDQRNALVIEDLSLFLSKDMGARWKMFGEVELGDAVTATRRQLTTRYANVDLERFYAEYRVSNGITLRVGKFLTPVGQWNLIHADPLVWSVSRPLTTTAAFARHSTGAMLYGTVNLQNHDLDYWLFADDSQAIGFARSHDLAYGAYGASSPLRNDFAHALGGQFLYHMIDDRLSVGASAVRYALRDPRQQYRLIGIDFAWTGRRVEFSGEALQRKADNPVLPDEVGGFLQAVVPLPRSLYLVGRYERYRSSIQPGAVYIRNIGLNYRPVRGLFLKLERLDGSRNEALDPSGWFFSVGAIF
ncbi:MAG: hypothetical protein KGJ96_04650 [Xanthomonadaceae bacterium]|nr:hypothetical protein [Xanthomonadaceae bacterium]